jgi:hypothetical protein
MWEFTLALVLPCAHRGTLEVQRKEVPDPRFLLGAH